MLFPGVDSVPTAITPSQPSESQRGIRDGWRHRRSPCTSARAQDPHLREQPMLPPCGVGWRAFPQGQYHGRLCHRAVAGYPRLRDGGVAGLVGFVMRSSAEGTDESLCLLNSWRRRPLTLRSSLSLPLAASTCQQLPFPRSVDSLLARAQKEMRTKRFRSHVAQAIGSSPGARATKEWSRRLRATP